MNNSFVKRVFILDDYNIESAQTQVICRKLRGFPAEVKKNGQTFLSVHFGKHFGMLTSPW